MKKLIVAIFLIVALTIQCQPTQVTVDVDWEADPTAQQFIIVIAEGIDTTNWPFQENMSWQDVDTTQLTRIYHLAPIGTGVSFMSSINGEYIQAAGFIVGEYGLTSLATVSNREKKPNVPNKMQFINLTIQPIN